MSIEAKLMSDLLRLADSVMAAVPGLHLSNVSKYVLGRTKALWQYRHRQPSVPLSARKYDRAIQSFADNWPAGLLWPDDIGRPPRTAEAFRKKWPKPRRRLSAQERREVLEAYCEGEPIADIAARYDIDQSYPTQLARRLGIDLRNPLGG